MPNRYELRSVNETPPGQWRFTVPQTGATFISHDWVQFTNSLREHYLANNIPLKEGWKDDLADKLCQQNMPLWHEHCKHAGKPKPRKGLSFGAIMSGLNVLKVCVERILKGEAAWIPQEEAERRAAICVGCDLNSKHISFGCGSCMGAFTKLLKLIIGNKKTSHDNLLGQCGVCSCALKASVHIPLDLQWNALDEEAKEKFRDPGLSYCWKRIDG